MIALPMNQKSRGILFAIIRSKWLLFAMFLVILINCIFAISYPLNVAESDNSNYLTMAHDNASNLIHASGYPLIIHALLKFLGISQSNTIYDPVWLKNIQLIQNAINIFFMVYFAILVKQIFNATLAAWMITLLGLSTLFMGAVNSFSPEWLQGDLILLSLLVAAKGYQAKETNAKVFYYLLCSVLVTVDYLVKYNSIVIVPFLLLFLFFERRRFFWKAKTILFCSVLSATLIFLFITFFHFPSTKTKQLNYDHAWVLISSIPPGYFNSPPDGLGESTLRWIALSTTVPPDYSVADAWRTIDTGAPVNVRDAFYKQYRLIIQMSRGDLLDYVKRNALPSGFNAGSSAIPLYWYIGLKETDELGVKVFNESVLYCKAAYFSKIGDGIRAWGAFQQQKVPFESNDYFGLRFNPALDKDGFKSFSVPAGEVSLALPYWSPTEKIWAPGENFLEKLSFILFPRFLEIVIASLAILSIFFSRNGQVRLLGFIVLGSAVSLALSGYILLGVRKKEYVSLLPTIALVYAFGLSWVSTIMQRHLNYFFSAKNNES